MCVWRNLPVCTDSYDCSDRNWLEFLAVLDATFADLTGGETKPSEEALDAVRANVQETKNALLGVVEKDGLKDRSGLLALLELEKRARAHGLVDGASQVSFANERGSNKRRNR